MITIGGPFSVWGAIAGATVITLLKTVLQGILPKLIHQTGNFEIIVFGIMIVAVLQWMRGGIWSLVERLLPPKPNKPINDSSDLSMRDQPTRGTVLLRVDGVTKAYGGLVAVKKMSFQLSAGEIVGLIGPNGAGKTTLLRIIAEVFTPTSGVVRVHGRLASLLALGVGFHPELTGRENIYLSSATLGLTTREIRATEADIIAFSELERFIDVPIKNYSSGMQARLGFAIAFQVRPEIFLIDEVFSVGDQHFQDKCVQRLEESRRAGRTFLVATHSLSFVEERCDRAALLVDGRIAAIGASKEVVGRYQELIAQG
jgi:ABC-type polysaccharide/polyol phosphate transport system ATPase subunit